MGVVGVYGGCYGCIGGVLGVRSGYIRSVLVVYQGCMRVVSGIEPSFC